MYIFAKFIHAILLTFKVLK